jgi:hypothetical protein
MPEISVDVSVYDPALPFKTFRAEEPTLDTWHEFVLITAKLRSMIPHVATLGEETLRLSGGMSMKVPKIEIGLQIGSIRIEAVQAVVVDEGFHDILLGSKVLDQVFTIGGNTDRDQRTSGEAHVSTARKDDPTGLALELFPVRAPIELRKFERLLKYQRRLYNILLVARGEVTLTVDALDRAIEDDAGIPEHLCLQLAWVDSGSIWVTLKSGSMLALRQLAEIFQTGASAKLAHDLDSGGAEPPSGVDQTTRDRIAREIDKERQSLQADNLAATYEQWRNEVRLRLSFYDELLGHLEDPEIVRELKRLKSEAIIQIANQELLPVVRNIPRPFDPPDTKFLLGHASGSLR